MLISKKKLELKMQLNPCDFLGKRYSVGKSVRSFFLIIFLRAEKNFLLLYNVSNIYWEYNKFHIVIKDIKDNKIYDFFIREKGTDLFNSKNIGFNITGSNNYEEKFFLFTKRLSKIFGTLSPLSIFNVLKNDSKIKNDYYKIFKGYKRGPINIIQDWGHELHSIRYIANEGVVRNIDQSFDIKLSRFHIHHSERECLAVSPNIPPEKEVRFFNYPKNYYDQSFDKYFYLDENEKNNYIKEKFFKEEFTDLDESNIIMGTSNDKLKNTLENVKSQLDLKGIESVSFNCCCVPRIIGDDIYSLLEKFKNKLTVPLIYSGQLEKTPYEQKILLLESYIKDIDETKIEIIKKSYSLFGFSETKYLKKIVEELSFFGLKLNSIFIPTIDVGLLPTLFKSELFIYPLNKFQEEIFQYPFKVINNNFLDLNYPYGINTTSYWLNTVLGYYGIKYQQSDGVKNIIKTYYSKVDYVKKSKFSVGIICLGLTDVEKIIEPSYFNNIDILNFLEEMGFNINIFVYTDVLEAINHNVHDSFLNEDNRELIFKILQEKSKKLNIIFFNSENELLLKIKTIGVNLIYSDINFDDRVYKMGINYFCLRNFNEGYHGALDTINEFIKMCELKYYSLFSNYVK